MGDLKVVVGEKFRSLVHLCPPLYRLCLKTVRDYGKIYYARLDRKYQYREKLRRLKNIKEGESCFIIGNGPSLRPEDLETLYAKGVDSFASNKIYKAFDSTNWRPTYFSVVDWKGIDEQSADNMKVPYLFFSDYYWRKHSVTNPNAYVFYGNRPLDGKLSSYKFSEDIAEQIYMKGSVTYTNFQLAVYLGYKHIYLLGMDNSYAYVMNADGKTVKSGETDNSHFYKDDNPSHIYSEKEAMDNCFVAAKQYADSHGIEIINATRGGKLELFPRVDFESALHEIEMRAIRQS